MVLLHAQCHKLAFVQDNATVKKEESFHPASRLKRKPSSTLLTKLKDDGLVCPNSRTPYKPTLFLTDNQGAEVTSNTFDLLPSPFDGMVLLGNLYVHVAHGISGLFHLVLIGYVTLYHSLGASRLGMIFGRFLLVESTQ